MMWLPVLLSALLLDLATAFTPPNIVIIVADDMGFNDVGFHGSEVRTPNIDALAGHGIVLNRHYAQSSCTPSRAALLTGRLPSNNGMQGPPLPAGIAAGLPLSEILFPQYFRDLGYRTHLVGKWHLGYETWEHFPTRRGFDTFFGYLNGFIGYYDASHTQSGLTGRDFFRDERPVWAEIYGTYITEALSREAASLIRNHPKEDPLLLFFHHNAPHKGNLYLRSDTPPDVQEDLLSLRQMYAETVRWVDDAVGEVVLALNDEGMLNNSIIVFMSDNGAPTTDPVWKYDNYGSNWPLRGEKMSLHDGGVRTVAALWGSMLNRPRVTDQLFHISDWLPTLYTAAGGSIEELKVDGVSQWASLLSSEQAPRKEVLVGLDGKTGLEAIINGEWKLIRNYPPTANERHTDYFYGESGRNSTYDTHAVHTSSVGRILGSPPSPYTEVRSVASPTDVCMDKDSAVAVDCHTKYCLYHIFEDPTECMDRASQYPEVVAALTTRLDFYRRTEMPQKNRTYDPAANPCHWDDHWRPWMESSAIRLSNLHVAVLLLVVYRLHTSLL